MGFFDFLENMPRYLEDGSASRRMNLRHNVLFADFEDEIRGAKVLDLAAHDGRWCYAFAGAGAASVVGVEARAQLVSTFSNFPDPALRNRVDLRIGDLFDGVRSEVSKGETYDIIAVFGIFYHIMDHFLLFQLLRDLKPKLIIVDSEFVTSSQPQILLVQERTDNVLNATPQYEGQKIAVKGVPSFGAMQMIADSLNYDLVWSHWDRVPKGKRGPVADYFRPKEKHKRRATCTLRLRDR